MGGAHDAGSWGRAPQLTQEIRGLEEMKEEQKWRIFHWVERSLARLDLIGDKGEFNRRRKRKKSGNLDGEQIFGYGWPDNFTG